MDGLTDWLAECGLDTPEAYSSIHMKRAVSMRAWSGDAATV